MLCDGVWFFAWLEIFSARQLLPFAHPVPSALSSRVSRMAHDDMTVEYVFVRNRAVGKQFTRFV